MVEEEASSFVFERQCFSFFLLLPLLLFKLEQREEREKRLKVLTVRRRGCDAFLLLRELARRVSSLSLCSRPRLKRREEEKERGESEQEKGESLSERASNGELFALFFTFSSEAAKLSIFFFFFCSLSACQPLQSGSPPLRERPSSAWTTLRSRATTSACSG